VLRPFEPMAQTTLAQVAADGSTADYVENMRWMHPLYAPLRRALLDDALDASQTQAVVRNLERLRAIPVPPWQRHVVIDAAGARLWMYEGDRAVDSMRVVVGKTDTQTPAMAGYIRYAVLNPYWNVPDNTIRDRIAPGVLSGGVAYLRVRGYEVLSGWGDDAHMLDPAKVDWRRVRDGTLEVRVRQRPGPTNAMGKVKYEFPNPLGIYLHDTPEKNLLQEDARQFSSGCIRLEDAERLGRWLLGGELPAGGSEPEEKIDLPQPVPVYVTYLTVHPDGDRIAVGPDPYGRDRSPVTTRAN
jgi:murein L,D-transpeptidase YcbB/YkuD